VASASTARKAPAKRSAPSRGGLARAATSSAQGKKLVLLGTIGTGALALVAAYRKPGDARRNPFRIALGVFIAGTLLAALAEVNPKLASAFAMLMLTTAAFVVGGDAWAGISAITSVKGDPTPPAIANAPTTPAPVGR
jgi:hypothetical protein